MSCRRPGRELATASIDSGHELMQHLESCDECRETWLAARLLGETKRTQPEAERKPSCPDDGALLEWIDGASPRSGAETLLRHLSDCPGCVRELSRMAQDLQRVEDATPVPAPEHLLRRAIAARPAGASRRRALARRAVGLAAAAGLGLIAIGIGLELSGPGRSPSPGTPTPALRGSAAETPRLTAPRGEIATAEALRFAWDLEGASSTRWRLLVVDLQTGRTVVDAETDGNEYTLDDDEVARLEPGSRYHWLVEPLDARDAPPAEAAAFRLAP